MTADSAPKNEIVSVVLAGAPGVGKLDTINALSERLDPRGRGRMVHLRASGARVVVADLPTFAVSGTLSISPRVTTLTGPVGSRQIWRQIIALADVLIEVVGTTPEHVDAGRAETARIKNDLASLGREDTQPLVVQVNETDVLGVTPVETVRDAIAPEHPWHATVASTGEGVVELFADVLDRALTARGGEDPDRRERISRHLLDIAAGRLS